MVPAGGSNSSVIMDPALTHVEPPEDVVASFETTHSVHHTPEVAPSLTGANK
jgi:hypothetical protein